MALLCQELEPGKRSVLLSIGRLAACKGLGEFVKEVLLRIVARHLEVLLLVVGDVPTDAHYAQAQNTACNRATAVATEPAAYKLRTIACGTGGVGDAASDGVSGRLVEPGDAGAYACAVLKLVTHRRSGERGPNHVTQFAGKRFGGRVGVVPDALGVSCA